jgi:hypothetical protein
MTYRQVAKPGLFTQAGRERDPHGIYDVTVWCDRCNAKRYISSGSVSTDWYCIVCVRGETRNR